MTVLAGVFRVGRDAELRRIPSGEAVINLSLAYNYGNKGNDGKRPTQWVDASLWGKRAEALAPHITKGSLVECVLGDVHIESFTKTDGTPSTKLAARVANFDFVSSPKPEGGNAAATHYPKTPTQNPEPPKAHGGGFDDMDDDIPF